MSLLGGKVTFLLHKSCTLSTEVVDGSIESLYYPDEKLDFKLRTGTPLQISFEKVDVSTALLCKCGICNRPQPIDLVDC